MFSFKYVRPALTMTFAMFMLCGVAYPYVLAGLGHVLVPEKAAGSLLTLNGQVVGSALVGQDFTDPRFLRGRPSAVGYNTYTAAQKADGDYAGVASGSANMGNSNPELPLRVERDMAAFLAAHPGVRAEDVPADLLTASGSGLDPHISPAAAKVQLPALARHTGLSETELEVMIDRNTTGRLGGVLGGDAVHVLRVNMDIARALNIVPGAAAVFVKD